MTKRIMTWMTCAAFALSPALYAADATTNNQPGQVGKAAAEGKDSGKGKMWAQIGIAAGAVAVVTVALVLVAKNHGSSHHSHS